MCGPDERSERKERKKFKVEGSARARYSSTFGSGCQEALFTGFAAQRTINSAPMQVVNARRRSNPAKRRSLDFDSSRDPRDIFRDLNISSSFSDSVDLECSLEDLLVVDY